MVKYRVTIVGCGERSGRHMRAYDRVDGAEVVACCALSPARREKVSSEFRIQAYASAEEMITKEKPDLVHLVTWPDTRAELMALVSELRVPGCIVEKPIATGVSDWKKLCKLNATTETKFAVCHQFRWHPHFVKCQEALQSGKLGKVQLLDFSAGMNISGQGTHILNYGMSLNSDSPVVRVFGAASGRSQMSSGHPGPDTTLGYILFKNGVQGVWINGFTAPRCGDPKSDWQHVRIAAYAERGSVQWEEFGSWKSYATIRSDLIQPVRLPVARPSSSQEQKPYRRAKETRSSFRVYGQG